MTNILVCDDDKEIVDAIEIYLQQEGYQIYKAYDGEQAIKVLKEMNIQLLIIDIMMPRLDGIHATLKIREFQQCPDYLPVCQIGGYGQDPWIKYGSGRLHYEAV